jgi:hypothetical protein
MSAARFVLVVAVGLFCATPRAPAVVIKLDTNERVKGFLKEDDGKRLTIADTPDPHDVGKVKLRNHLTVLHELDMNVLGALSRDNPKGYYDYAKELASHKEDPEAVCVARRLYLSAAYLDRERYGRLSLLGMIELADTPAERRKYHAMTFLLDPKAGPEFLKEDGVPPARRDGLEAAALQSFTKALQLYREGEIPRAIDAANRAGVVTVFTTAKMDHGEFIHWCNDAYCPKCIRKNVGGVMMSTGQMKCTTCNGNRVTTDAFGRSVPCPTCKGQGTIECPECHGTRILDRPADHVRTVLRAELWALGQDGSGDDIFEKQSSVPKSWSAVLQSGPVSPLSLETLLEGFDPRKCRWQDVVSWRTDLPR